MCGNWVYIVHSGRADGACKRRLRVKDAHCLVEEAWDERCSFEFGFRRKSVALSNL